MTVTDPKPSNTERFDPFALPSAPAPSRPRLLSYVGRWGRARRWLEPNALRVLDVGCSFGYGSAAVAAGGPAGRRVIGIERDPEHLAHAAQSFPWVTILDADATDLPVADGSVDAVLMLDVIEHIADAEPGAGRAQPRAAARGSRRDQRSACRTAALARRPQPLRGPAGSLAGAAGPGGRDRVRRGTPPALHDGRTHRTARAMVHRRSRRAHRSRAPGARRDGVDLRPRRAAYAAAGAGAVPVAPRRLHPRRPAANRPVRLPPRGPGRAVYRRIRRGSSNEREGAVLLLAVRGPRLPAAEHRAGGA